MEFVKTPLVSVVIPTYNREKTILQSVESVLSQTYKNIEVIVVDDCSIDETKNILEKIDDARLRYFRLEKNSGACAARNKGVEIARGDFISFNDSDDVFLPEKIERQLSFLQENGADVALCRMKCFDEVNNFLHFFPKDETAEGELTYEDLLAYNSCSTQTLFGKAECFKSVPFDSDMPRLQDWDEILRLSEKYKVFYKKEVLANNFLQTDSITQHPEKGVLAMQKIYEKHKGTVDASGAITVAFAKKMANFKAKAGMDYAEELKVVSKNSRALKDKVKYFLYKIGIYKLR